MAALAAQFLEPAKAQAFFAAEASGIRSGTNHTDVGQVDNEQLITVTHTQT